MAIELEPILAQIRTHPSLVALAQAITHAPGGRLHAAPALTAARPAIVAALAKQHGGALLYVVQNGDLALRAREDLSQWLDSERVLLFPASDAMPYEPMSPGNDVVAARLRVLKALGAGSEGVRTAEAHPLVIVAPIKALLQPTMSPADYASASIRLRRGEEHTIDKLMTRWVAMGYRSAPTVEEPGEINRRGGIVDIFPPGDELPLRIEFFGDEIDSLRRFDPITQRSEAQVREAVVGPPHEIPFWRSAEALARMRALDASGLRREARDEWEAVIERIAHGERFEGRALYAPFFWEAAPKHLVPSSLFTHLPAAIPIVFSEILLLAQQAAEQHHHASERRTAHSEAGELLPDFPRPYLLWEELLAQASAQTLVNLSNNDVSVNGWELQANETPPTPVPIAESLFVTADLFGGQLR
ncbi:MAG: transcription-repair coupling factor, partial [Chloroflexi bacterium SZAS-1]|nr:transcription-repair coupling factor [Chloroflexi bacterium SZAS-1]